MTAQTEQQTSRPSLIVSILKSFGLLISCIVFGFLSVFIYNLILNLSGSQNMEIAEICLAIYGLVIFIFAVFMLFRRGKKQIGERTWSLGLLVWLFLGFGGGMYLVFISFDLSDMEKYSNLMQARDLFIIPMLFLMFLIWYILCPKICGFSFNEVIVQIHFWVTFLPVIMKFLFVMELIDKAFLLMTFGVIGTHIIDYLLRLTLVVFLMGLIEALIKRRPVNAN